MLLEPKLNAGVVEVVELDVVAVSLGLDSKGLKLGVFAGVEAELSPNLAPKMLEPVAGCAVVLVEGPSAFGAKIFEVDVDV